MIEDLLDELQVVKNDPVLVEGPNDVKALEKLGFTNVRQMNGPLYKIVEDLEEYEELIILTDLDSHGKKLYKHFYTEFTKRGVRINNRLRLLLFESPVKEIEGLASFLERQTNK